MSEDNNNTSEKDNSNSNSNNNNSSSSSNKTTMPYEALHSHHRVSNLGRDDHDRNRTTDLLNTSCDRCRAKKIKCDGKRPCEACRAACMPSNVKNVDLTRIECVYSLSKKRGPPPKRQIPAKNSSSSSGDKEKSKVRHHSKKRRSHAESQQPITVSWQGPGEFSAAAAASNHAVATSFLNSLLGTINPATSSIPTAASNNAAASSIWNPLLGAVNPSTLGLLQNQQAGLPLIAYPLNPILAALQQHVVSSVIGSALGVPATITTNATSTAATQQLALLQQLQQLANLQQLQQQQQQRQQQQPPAQQQQSVHQQHPVQQHHAAQQQGLPTLMAAAAVLESSLSSSAEDGLRSELEQLSSRLNNLEAENANIKRRIELLEMKENDKEKE